MSNEAFEDYEPTIGLSLNDNGTISPGRGRRRKKAIQTEDDGDARVGLPDEPPPGWAEP